MRLTTLAVVGIPAMFLHDPQNNAVEQERPLMVRDIEAERLAIIANLT